MHPSDSDIQTKAEREPALPPIRRFWHPVEVEKALAPYQLMSSIAYTQVLVESGVITNEVGKRVIEGLQQLQKELSEGKHFLDNKDPDIYSGLTRRLAELVGQSAESINVARSLDERLATDVRLWVRERLCQILGRLLRVRQVLLRLSEIHQEVMMPGYSHMQPTSPEFFSFFFMANESRLQRDYDRMAELMERVNLLPMSFDSVSNTEVTTDRALLAKLLKFDGVLENSFDSFSDWDYLLEFASMTAIAGTHISQLASELLLWSTYEFSYVRLPRVFSFRGERFPLKRNPEILESLRSASSALTGRLTELLTLLKGIPLGFSHEANEALPAVLEVFVQIDLALELCAEILPALIFDTKKMNNIAEMDLENRANVIDYLIEKEFEPDKAIKIVDNLIEYCKQRKKELVDLAPSEWQEFSPAFETDIYKYVGSQASREKTTYDFHALLQTLSKARQALESDDLSFKSIDSKIKLES